MGKARACTVCVSFHTATMNRYIHCLQPTVIVRWVRGYDRWCVVCGVRLVLTRTLEAKSRWLRFRTCSDCGWRSEPQLVRSLSLYTANHSSSSIHSTIHEQDK
jgi:hypothetical protein